MRHQMLYYHAERGAAGGPAEANGSMAFCHVAFGLSSNASGERCYAEQHKC